MKLTSVTTTFPEKVKRVVTAETPFVPDVGIENEVVNLYPEMTFQTFEGFGGAFTDSAGYVYSLMNETQKKEMIHRYFDKDDLNYQFGRIHLDSCDFSLEQYEAGAVTGGVPQATNEAGAWAADTVGEHVEAVTGAAAGQSPQTGAGQITAFSLERPMRYVLPLLRDIERETGRAIPLAVTPWSPPAAWKTNGERSHGGHLKEEYREAWAQYICRYIEELRALGLTVNRMSVQNEAAAIQTWDSCLYSPEEEKEFLRDYLYPALAAHGLDDIEVYIWDHNKERAFERACAEIDEVTTDMIAGVAVHWYSGDHFEALDLIRRKFPDKKIIFSEACIEYYKFDADDCLANAQKYAHDIIGDLNGGMSAFYDWNLLLDETGGPNHVGNLCDAPYLYDTKNGVLMERNTLEYIRHFSHFIRPGAVRIGFSRYTDELDVTAFRNPDGSLVCVILNRGMQARNCVIRLHGETASVVVEGGAIMTAVIEDLYL